MYFSFVALKYAHKLNMTESYPIIKEGSQVGSYFLFFIIIAFLLYANVLFIKPRSYELALYQTLGLSKFNIIYILMLVTNIYNYGNIRYYYWYFWFKTVINDCLYMLLGIKEKVPIIFSLRAVFETLMLIGVAYFLTSAQNFILVFKQSDFTDVKE